jgi:peptide subunit release factor 1 (eRF1)
MTMRIQQALRDLGSIQHSEHPVLSVYLDWVVDSSGQRQALTVLGRELDRVAAERSDEGDSRASFEADRARIEAYLATEAPKEARSLAIFACNASGLWGAIPLPVALETQVLVAATPQLFTLARVVDDYEPFAVAVAEGQEAQIYVLSLEGSTQVDDTEAREEINRVKVGGWSQLRYHNHTGFVLQLHMNDMATALQDAVDRYHAQHVVILANDSIKGNIRKALPAQLQERVVELGAHQRTDDPEQLFAALAPLMESVEREQEQALLERLADQLASKGGLAFAGEQDVAQALLKGQVDTLVLSADYAGGPGAECPTCGLLRPGQRQRCPYDGSEMRPVELREALVGHTLRQGGRVEVVGIEGALVEHGGVAALLRFRDDLQQ